MQGEATRNRNQIHKDIDVIPEKAVSKVNPTKNTRVANLNVPSIELGARGQVGQTRGFC